MKNNLVKIALSAALIAIVVTVVLKLLGQSNPVVMGGAVAGAIVGGMAFNKKKE